MKRTIKLLINNTLHMILIVITLILVPSSVSEPFIQRIHAKTLLNTYPFELPTKLNTTFYLTSTPKTHYPSGKRAAIDIQIIDEFGFIDKGASLYAPFDGYAQVSEATNDSKILQITKTDKQWRIDIAHIMDDTKRAQKLLNTYPKHVAKGELVAFQGDSGYTQEGARFATHTHFEVFKLENGRYTNENSKIDICSKLNLKEYCNYCDTTGRVILLSK